ncbi:Cellulose-binding protein OS=Streptomyces tendae OX=1932 GN=GUR47_27720 PE=4 SV=1 [Streptomyces tendae]
MRQVHHKRDAKGDSGVMSVSGASASPHGFVTVRGRERGYRPEQVEAYAAALSEERDAAWERAARLTVLAREMEEDLEDLREVVAQLTTQDYAVLGERARDLFRLGEEEAEAVRERARGDARRLMEDARAHADGVREAARAARRRRTRRGRRAGPAAAARGARGGGRGADRGTARGEGGACPALAALREMRRRTAGAAAEQSRELAERWAAAERTEEERARALDARYAESAARAEQQVRDAEQRAAARWAARRRRCRPSARARTRTGSGTA